MNVVCLAALVIGSGSCGPPRTWDFNTSVINEPPSSCEFEGCGADGEWRVIEDDGEKVLAQLDRTQEPQRMTLALLKESHVCNVRVSSRIRVIEGETEQSGGIVWRFEDPKNYMLARLDVMDGRVALYRVCQGHRTMFGVARNLTLEKGRWYTLRVEHKDNVVKVYLDDEIQFIRWSKHLDECGKVGMWAKGDSAVQFDDFRLFNRDHSDDRCRDEEDDNDVER